MDFYVGIDVSKFKHTVAIIDEEGEIRKKSFDFMLGSMLVSLNTLSLSLMKKEKLERKASIFLILEKGLIHS